MLHILGKRVSYGANSGIGPWSSYEVPFVLRKCQSNGSISPFTRFYYL